jgi:hypothetical protein
LRTTLVAALVACANRPMQTRTRRFLAGLSADELQFLAEFQGCCILESGELDGRIDRFQRMRVRRSTLGSADQEQKMILLLEYLRRAGAPERARAQAA